ncbi:S41 family peptidase [Pedobacter aquatilis]|uniref:S41 family peptidase n=1 Tax=Pedobacter aquatilis TaxID=351343 RepID=UPI00292F38B0|nr:S41 family peptidase [Pedobacter aquatilis]
MKTILPIIILLTFSYSSFAKQEIPETKKIETFIKIWGFLKYHHSIIAKGKIDWDREFTTRIKDLNKLNSKQAINQYYLNWIKGIGKPVECKKCLIDQAVTLKVNDDFKLLTDSTILDKTVIAELDNIKKNRNQQSNYYISQVNGIGNANFDNEKEYPDSIYPSSEMRLLTLSRYWNIINYFFPYKYKTDQPWNNVLGEMIPKFKDAGDTTTYHLAILELTAKIDDSHGKFSTIFTNKYFGLKWVPFSFKIIDNKAVVIGFYNEELCKNDDIRVGDVFVKIGGSTIEEIVKRNSKFIGASNEVVKLRDTYNILFNGQTSKVETEFQRTGIIEKKTLRRYSFNEINYKYNATNVTDTSKILNGNIGYINMGNLEQKQVDVVLNNLKNTKAIIFDIRNYPKGTMRKIADFLNDKPKPFVLFTIPDVNNPSIYNYKEPSYCGKVNPNYYKGKVILLCNEKTQSHAEYTLMALKTAPNAIVVGSQTSGADGNASYIVLPGGLKTMFTSLGTYYPDKTETQRIGIVPDVMIKPTIEGIKAGKDEVLEKALAIANN